MLIEAIRTSMQTSVQVGWRIVVVLWCLAVGWAGCAQTSVKQTLDRHSLGDGDLLALLPRGQDALLDVDVAGLRQLAAVPTLMKFLPVSFASGRDAALPPPAQSPAQSPELVPEQLLQSIEAVVVGLRSLASSELRQRCWCVVIFSRSACVSCCCRAMAPLRPCLYARSSITASRYRKMRPGKRWRC